MIRRKPIKTRPPERKPERQIAYAPRPRAVLGRAANEPSVLALALALPQAEPQDPAAFDAAGRRHMGRVAAIGFCVLCRLLHRRTTEGLQVHHIRYGQGGADRANHFLTMLLCWYCHEGEHGIHGDRALLRQANVTELDLLAETLALIFEGARP